MTTIAVVAPNVRLTKAHATEVAEMADDGLGRAVRPAHGVGDGDTVFVLNTAQRRENRCEDLHELCNTLIAAIRV